MSVKLLAFGFRPAAFARIDFKEFRELCNWLGVQSLPLIGLSAIFIGLAMTLETVLEMNKYAAQDLSGAVIAQGLLRELGPLTVSLAWGARVASRFACEAAELPVDISEIDYAQTFFFPRWLAGVLMSIPLSLYGLVIGFATAAIFAPFLGVSSTNDFLETARTQIHQKGLIVYFIKLILINPSIAVFVGCACGRDTEIPAVYKAATACTHLFIAGYIANWFLTWSVYQP